MFIVTNRQVFADRTDLKAFGSGLNPLGSNELRLAEAKRGQRGWKVSVLPDEITPAMADEVGLELTDGKPIYASSYVAKRLMARINPKLVGKRSKGRNLVLFVHGFNNDMKAALDRAKAFEDEFEVEVLVFSWPANGGGVKGVVSYLSDKRDARASIGAFDCVLGKMRTLLDEVHEEHVKRVTKLADERFGDDADAWDEFYTAEANKWCPFTLNLVLHSMGNYLFKCLLSSTVYRASTLLFDNVVMVAADTNNDDHAEWVERIPVRKRIFITINEDDQALKASRMKMGELQKARLGHYLFRLDATNATYVNFTKVPKVGNEHAYFEGKCLLHPMTKQFFKAAFNGIEAETTLGLIYNAARNTYEFK